MSDEVTDSEIKKLKEENQKLKKKLTDASNYVDRFNMILNHSQEWVWEVDAEGVYTYASPYVEKVLGYKPEELIGKTPFDFMSENEAHRVGGIFMEAVSKEKKISKLVNISIHKDGSDVYNEASGEPFYSKDGFLLGYRGVDLDTTAEISDIINLEKTNLAQVQIIEGELAQQKEAFETIFEYSSDGTLLIEDGKFIACNQAIVKIMGASSKDEVLNTHPSKLSPILQPDGQASYEKAEEMMNICLDKGYNNFDWVHTRSDGEDFWTEILLTRLNINDRLVIHVSLRDISERKKLESDLENSNAKYKQLISRLDSKVREQTAQLIKQSRMAQMGELLSMIAHQWRQPLGSIASVAVNIKVKLSILETQKYTEENFKKINLLVDEKMSEIEKYVNSLSTTIDDFRTLYKPDKVMKENPIVKPIHDALGLLKFSFNEDKIKVKELYSTVSSILMHNNEIMQVVLNILKNAKDNFLEKRIVDPIISIKTTLLEDRVKIDISDNGGGIDESIKDKIFDPYFSTKTAKNGTGLGLYMCRIIIEDHHDGELYIANIGEGVCFSIELPIKLL